MVDFAARALPLVTCIISLCTSLKLFFDALLDYWRHSRQLSIDLSETGTTDISDPRCVHDASWLHHYTPGRLQYGKTVLDNHDPRPLRNLGPVHLRVP